MEVQVKTVAVVAENWLIKYTSSRGVEFRVRRVRMSERASIELGVARVAPEVDARSEAFRSKVIELVVRAAIMETFGLKQEETLVIAQDGRGVDALVPMAGTVAAPAVYDALTTEEAIAIYSLAVGGITKEQAGN